MTRKRKNEEDRKAKALATARYAAKGLIQEQIAETLALTQPEVSRLLQIARNEKWLRQAPSIVRHEIDDDLWKRVEREHFSAPDNLEQRIRDWAPKGHSINVHVVKPGESESFGYAAAHHVASILAGANIVGIMYGYALAAMIGGLERRTRSGTANVRVLPLCGEPFFADNSRTAEASSSRLAEDLELAVNGPQDPAPARPSLFGVPAYIPTSFGTADRKVLTRYFEMNPGYREIYGSGGGKGLIDEVQTIITGVGGLSSGSPSIPHTGVFLAERLAQEDLVEGELQSLVLGDLGGVLLPREGLVPMERKRVEALNRGWTGASFDQLQRCARDGSRARERRGVVVLAEGVGKAKLIRETVRLGVVNELVLGDDLASALDGLGS